MLASLLTYSIYNIYTVLDQRTRIPNKLKMEVGLKFLKILQNAFLKKKYIKKCSVHSEWD